MDYIKVAFPNLEKEAAEELMAQLMAIGFEGFEETDKQIIGYISATGFDEQAIQAVSQEKKWPYELERLPARNWNASWESNFQPVLIDGFCSIRADFHAAPEHALYDIVITPKMSFGTGHHATTALMITLMRDIPLKDKRVLDFGTGTGVLAILAALMGATSILAIDNDEWAVTNSIENCTRNHTPQVTVSAGSLDQVQGTESFDVILANINRNILLADMEQLATLLKPGSTLLLSGILLEDVPQIRAAAEGEGFRYRDEKAAQGWAALLFEMR